LRLLAAELLDRPGDMMQAHAAANLPELWAQAHSLTGAAANLGAGRVARAARAVELAAPGTELDLALRRLKVEAATAHRALVGLIAADPQFERRSA
jgi:HPt (histidine-containing phosphotransfer) domain-containing protein